MTLVARGLVSGLGGSIGARISAGKVFKTSYLTIFEDRALQASWISDKSSLLLSDPSDAHHYEQRFQAPHPISGKNDYSNAGVDEKSILAPGLAEIS